MRTASAKPSSFASLNALAGESPRVCPLPFTLSHTQLKKKEITISPQSSQTPHLHSLTLWELLWALLLVWLLVCLRAGDGCLASPRAAHDCLPGSWLLDAAALHVAHKAYLVPTWSRRRGRSASKRRVRAELRNENEAPTPRVRGVCKRRV